VKRLIVTCRVVILTLFIIKLLFLSESLQITSILPFFQLYHFDQAIAQTATPPPTPTPVPVPNPAAQEVKVIPDDSLQKERDLLVFLQKKQKELEARENAIKADEQKVIALKKEIMDKIDALKLLETQLGTRLDTDKSNDIKKLKDLAKVYEATLPQKAAAMLEKLEVGTAAWITINMKRDRAGLIWGYLTPQKAVAITNEISRTNRSPAE
jgi:flagellar motility protein MotE (MotC chaperone)